VRRLCRLRDNVVVPTGYSQRELPSHSNKNGRQTHQESHHWAREQIFENISERNLTRVLKSILEKGCRRKRVAIRTLPSSTIHYNKGEFSIFNLTFTESPRNHVSFSVLLHRPIASKFLATWFFYIFRQIGIKHETNIRDRGTISLRFYFGALTLCGSLVSSHKSRTLFHASKLSRDLILFISAFA